MAIGTGKSNCNSVALRKNTHIPEYFEHDFRFNLFETANLFVFQFEFNAK